MARPGLVLAPIVGIATLLTGCGNVVDADVIGMTAMTKDRGGNPEILVKVCRKDVDTIEVSAGREGLAEDEPSPALASWTTDEPGTEVIRFPIQSPPAGWSPTADTEDTAARLSFAPDSTYIVLAQRSLEDAEAMQVAFEGRDLEGLEPGEVLVRSGGAWTIKRFEGEGCERIAAP